MAGAPQAFGLATLFLLVGCATAVCGASLMKICLIDQTLDFGFALAILLGICAATGGLMMTKNVSLLLAWCLVLVVACALIEPLGNSANKRALKRMNEEDIEKFKRAIEFDPNNSAAHRFLADIYFNENRYDEAIAEYKAAIKLNPHDVSALRRKLNYVLELREEELARHPHRAMVQRALNTGTAVQPGPAAPGAPVAQSGNAPAQTGAPAPLVRRHDVTMCPACRLDTPSASKTCVHCGEQINLGFVEWLARPENFRDLTRQFVVCMLVAVVLLAVFTALPIEVKACVLMASLAVGGFYFLRGLGG
jgi:hypothetical protein